MSDDRRFDNADWQLGMDLPSRKKTHAKKKKGKKEQQVETEVVTTAEAELALGQAETAAATAVPVPGFVDQVSHDERELLLNGEEDDDDTILNPWQKALLFVLVPLVLLIALAWGKLAYVHQVPDLVRHNTTAYDQGQGYLVLKPWWFGPPVFELDRYIDRANPDDFGHFRIKMGDYSGIVEEPQVLWTFQQDILQ